MMYNWSTYTYAGCVSAGDIDHSWPRRIIPGNRTGKKALVMVSSLKPRHLNQHLTDEVGFNCLEANHLTS